MPETTMLHVRVDQDVKDRASDAFAAMGLTMSEAVRAFLKRVAVEQAIPFPIKVPNAVTQAAMVEARAMTHARFANSDDLFDDLGEAGR